MGKAKSYQSDIKAAIHQTASDLYEVGLMDKQTMRRFDESCLTPIHGFTAQEIRALREREDVSQTVFALYLNVPKDSVSQWERGAKHPSGPSLKLLSLVQKKRFGSHCLNQQPVLAWQPRDCGYVYDSHLRHRTGENSLRDELSSLSSRHRHLLNK